MNSDALITPLNLSKLGFRYFRIFLESKAFSKKFIRSIIGHPNTGYIFEGAGWSGKKRLLGIGLWATSNAEVADISTNIRSIIPHSYKVVYQSELTRLEYFNQHKGARRSMVLIDELEQKQSINPLELEYLKILSVDSSLSFEECARLLNISPSEIEVLDKKLKEEGVFYGTFIAKPLSLNYTKFFVDTTALTHEQVEHFFSLLRQDSDCFYLARGNGIYNVEFEYMLNNKEEFSKKYGHFLYQSKKIIFDTNLFTNLFPQSKLLNTRLIKEKFIGLADKDGTHFDFNNSELWYVNHEGVKNYLDIYQDKSYRKSMMSSEVSLFKKVSAYLTQCEKGTFNIIDLGSGDGRKGRDLILSLGEVKTGAYFPVDVQEIELNEAIRTHANASYAVHPTIVSFDKLTSRFPISYREGESNVYLLFGGTYGNFKHTQINDYLKPLLGSSTDRLLIGMPVRDHTSKGFIVRSYLNSQIENVAFGVLSQIGFNKEDFESNLYHPNLKLQVRWEEYDRLRACFVLKRSKSLHGVYMEAGTRFDILSSWKPTQAEFSEGLSDSFEVENMITNKSFAIAVCKRKSV